MYAITDTGWRCISSDSVIQDGETVVETIPQSLIDFKVVIEYRSIRDRMLNACDWRMKVDSPMDAAHKSAYTNYRQALRDVPQQAGFPTTINWPIEP